MVLYLFDVTSFDGIQQVDHLDLLRLTVQSELYDHVALNIFNKDKELASKMLQLGNSEILSISSSLECRGNLKIFSGAYSSPVWRKFVKCDFHGQETRERYVQKKLALEKLWTECKRSNEDKLLELVKRESLLHSSAQEGNVGFLVVVTRIHPHLIWSFNHKRQSIFHIAVIYREEKVFSLLHQMGGIKKLAITMSDDDGNNLLHLAGKLRQPINKNKTIVEEGKKIMPPSLLRISGAAREILWFKEVEKIAPPLLKLVRNTDGKTPKELFREEHKVLLKEGERWMKDTANSCMLVATLIATMVFVVGFTAPGGYNDDNGIPILLELNGFKVFTISDAVALFTSIVSIIMFLSILTSVYVEDDFLVSLPAKLLFGLTMLFVSIFSMLLAFAATFFLVYSNHTGWEPKLIIACAGVPLALFGCL